MFYESKTISEHSKDLKFGDIILVRYPMINIIAWLVQIFLGETYMHSAIFTTHDTVFDITSGREAGYSSLSKLKYAKVTVLRYKGGLDAQQSWQLLQKMESIKGAKYDYAAIGYMLLIYVLSWFFIDVLRAFKKVNPWDDESRMFCSQLTAFVYEDFNIIDNDYTNAVCKDFLDSDKLEIVYSDYSK